MKLVYVTGNKNKLLEVSALLKKHAPQVELTHEGLDLPEYQGSKEDISKRKVKEAFNIIKKPVIVEDTSLSCEALNGMPGPYIKWFCNKKDEHQFKSIKLMLDGFDNYNAEAMTIFGYYDEELEKSNSDPILCFGGMKGKIVSPRGDPTFGWDSVFEPEERVARTYGEMSKEEKNLKSHRSNAVEALGKFLVNKDEDVAKMNKKKLNNDSHLKLVYVTGNKNKLLEVSALLKKHAPQVELTHEGLDLPEYQGSMEDISKRKVKEAFNIIKKPVIVEDTSLCCEALNGMPGPYIKWFCNKKDEHQFKSIKLMLDGFGNYNAEAVTIFGYYDEELQKSNSDPILCTGRMKGKIVSPRGDPTFGWDSVFEPDERVVRTYGEMSKEEKNLKSHRSNAVEALGKFLVNKEKKPMKAGIKRKCSGEDTETVIQNRPTRKRV